MADIILLHWNIEQLSNEKLNDANGQALVNYIAEVVARSGANIVCLLEVKNSAVNNVRNQLIAAINVANGALVNQWHGLSLDSQKNSEAYVVLWQLGHNFVPLLPAAGGGAHAIHGLTNRNYAVGGNPLHFNGRLTRAGGRKPLFVTFEATDGANPRRFTVLSYHVMFGEYSPVGVIAIGRVAESRNVDDAGNNLAMAASLVCGDFNVDFDPNAAGGAYANLRNVVPSNWSTAERTSLLMNTPGIGFPTPGQYRANAYDNIFKYALAGLPPAGGGTVPDLINDSTTSPPGSGQLINEITPFVRDPIKNGAMIQHIPPQDFHDAWHIVRHAISNHLPVFARMVI